MKQSTTIMRPAFEHVAEIEETAENIVSLEPMRYSCEYKDLAMLTQESGGKKPKGRLGRMAFAFKTADTLNQNRRIYPIEVFRAALVEFQDRMDRNQIFGELDHPDTWNDGSGHVLLAEAAIKVQEAALSDDGDISVVVDILDNAHGRQLISVMDIGGNPGVSQRAFAMWREATDDERERFKIPEGEFVVVAEALRLITYDVVSEPGFSDAHSAKVTENRGASNVFKQSEIKTKAPEVYAAIVAEGKALALGEVETKVNEAIESRKPQIVADAVAAKDAEMAKAQETHQVAIDALASIKPILESLGIVNEKITDVDAASRLATAEAKNAELTKALESRDTVIVELTAVTEAAKNQQLSIDNMKGVLADLAANGCEHVKAISTELAKEPVEVLISREALMAKATGLRTLLESVGATKDTADKPADESVNTDTRTPGQIALDAAIVMPAFASSEDAPGAGAGDQSAETKAANELNAMAFAPH